jgi:hypothetical protein
MTGMDTSMRRSHRDAARQAALAATRADGAPTGGGARTEDERHILRAAARRSIALVALALAIAAPGCGDDDASPAPDAGADLGEVDAGLPDAGPDDAGPGDAGPPDAGDGAAAPAPLRIEGFDAYSNCMPIVAPDPIVAFWELVFESAADAPVPARVTSATLTYSTGAGTTTSDATVDTPTFTANPGVNCVEMRKDSQTNVPTTACTTFCSDPSAKARLTLTLDVGGAAYTAMSSEATLSCVY